MQVEFHTCPHLHLHPHHPTQDTQAMDQQRGRIDTMLAPHTSFARSPSRREEAVDAQVQLEVVQVRRQGQGVVGGGGGVGTKVCTGKCGYMRCR